MIIFINKRRYMRKLTTEEFIEKAKKLHGGKYDYSQAEYINAKTKVCIVCPEHGEFWQAPDKHLHGHGCPMCHPFSYKNTDWFVNESRKIHGNRYDYSLTEYTGALNKVRIICPTHGVFEQIANNHLHGQGCPKCHKVKSQKNLDDFITEAKNIHGDKYDYSKVEYRGAHTRVCIVCPEHGEFWQTPANHLSGKGCRKCYGRYNMSTADFINESYKIHGDKYDYSKVLYSDTTSKVCIICPEHGEFWQTPAKHLMGHGCPICKQSHLELEIRNLLLRNNILFEQQKTFDWLKNVNNLKLDFYIPDKKIAIECQGIQHFEPSEYFGGVDTFNKQVEMDELKYNLCESHDIKILYYTNIPGYKSLTKKELVGIIKTHQ